MGTIHTEGLQALLHRWDTVKKEELYAWSERFCRYNTFEISIPVLRDADTAPAGSTGVIISVLFDYELTTRIHAKGWYEEFANGFADQIVNTISASLYPGLKEKVTLTPF